MKKHLLTLILLAFISLTAKSQYSGLIIKELLKTDTTSIGQKITYPDFADPAVTMLKITIPPGKSTGWHKHNIPVFAYVVKGTLTVELEDHREMKFNEESTFAEMRDTYHNGKNMENSDLILIAIYMGGKGQKLSIPKEE
ncbi:MAG TPA: cupin domain-containing protein [Prolixibacteraceae bacterium]|nr:cupin domain-containing protein [Prolixibacteraceae bacterium]